VPVAAVDPWIARVNSSLESSKEYRNIAKAAFQKGDYAAAKENYTSAVNFLRYLGDGLSNDLRAEVLMQVTCSIIMS